MKTWTADQERRRGVVWLIGSVAVLIVMSGLWWLVEETNEEGSHDAELLPYFALIPLAIGIHHLIRSRTHHP